MANGYIVSGTDLTAIADTIRTKGKTTESLVFPDGFVSAIEGIEAGESVEQATPTITVSDGGLITASATQEAGLVAAGTKSATKQLTVQAAQTITPGTSNKTIASGRYLTGTQTIKGDSNLKAENIKKDVSIFGVSGTYEGLGAEIAYLYNQGTINTSLTGGFSHSGYYYNGDAYTAPTINANNVQFIAKDSAATMQIYGTVNPINLTNFSTLYARVKSTGTGGLILRIAPSKASFSSTTATASTTSGANKEETIKINLSGISGSYYIGVLGGGQVQPGYLYELWLAP